MEDVGAAAEPVGLAVGVDDGAMGSFALALGALPSCPACGTTLAAALGPVLDREVPIISAEHDIWDGGLVAGAAGLPAGSAAIGTDEWSE